MAVQIAIIGGDGIGHELAELMSDLLKSCFNFHLIKIDAGFENFWAKGENLTEIELKQIGAADGILFGATATPSYRVDGYVSPILLLRRYFDLYANVRPVKSLLPKSYPVDIVLIRENLEGLYSRRERRNRGYKAVAEKVVTRGNTERLARFAFDYARKHGRKKVIVVHKSNVLKISDGLFREVCLDVAAEYEDIEAGEQFVDSAAYQIVRDPSKFDVILTTNMYGDILSDVVAGVSDGLGFAPSISVGPSMVLAEPVHGAALDIAGKGIANPYGVIFSFCMLLDWLGCQQDAKTLREASYECIGGSLLTPDAGGACSTQDVFARLALLLSMT